MRPYTFYMHQIDRNPPEFGFVYCDGDEAAEATARLLLAGDRKLMAVEVFDGRSRRWTAAARTGRQDAVEGAQAR